LNQPETALSRSIRTGQKNPLIEGREQLREKQRNATRARIKWMFTTEKARAKMGRAYPDTAKES
jgi:hypothetical protein